MADIKVAVINASTVVSDIDGQNTVDALQVQVRRDFAPVWGIDADLVFVKKGDPVPVDHWWLVILDDSDQAGALGYHDITDQLLPMGKVFAATDLLYHSKWSVTASHELLEMLADPTVNLTALYQTAFDPNQNVVSRLYSYEVCDPCEADEHGYDINGVTVSDFVYPSWFESFSSQTTQFDKQNYIRQQFTLLPGGYTLIYDISSGTGWQQVFMPAAAQKVSYSSRAQVGSRRERRRINPSQWLKSNLKQAARA